jgi:polygalacturonase
MLATLLICGALVPVSEIEAKATVSFPKRVCDVTRYGARGTRVFLDTAAFQRAIDDCARLGGGTVHVPRGEYLIAPIFLRSNIRLHLADYSELVGVTDTQPYKVTKATEAYVTNVDWIALINIADAENVAITGKGRIDGQGATWWDRWREQARKNMRGGGTNRPRLIHAVRSRNLLFDGFGALNSPSFHLVVKDSEDVTVNGMSFVALAHSPNTDAIDPIDSRNMLITNNFFDVGDDVVAIKSLKVNRARPDAAVENIVIRGNKGLAGRGICIGSETIGGVRNVLVEDNELIGSMYGIRIKTPRERGGIVRDIVFRNNRMTDVETPMVFSGYYTGAGYDETAVAQQLARDGGFILGHQIYPGDAESAQPYKPNSTPWIRNVRVEGLRATGADRAGIVVGLPERSIEGLVFRNVQVSSKRGLLVRHAVVKTDGLRVTSKDGKPLVLERGAQVANRPQHRQHRR